ncbi:hypothetical protein [Peribacillus sp. N1]
MSIKTNMNSLKKMKIITYPKLSPHERFKKFIKAYADNDTGQCKKLVDSCPKYTYIETDNEFTERVKASDEIVSTFLLQLLEYDKVIAFYKLDIVNGRQKQAGLGHKRLGEIYGFLQAFEEFCKNIVGVYSEQLIQAWYGYDDKYIQISQMIKDYVMIMQVEPDEEAKKQWLDGVFNYTWERRVKG